MGQESDGWDDNPVVRAYSHAAVTLVRTQRVDVVTPAAYLGSTNTART